MRKFVLTAQQLEQLCVTMADTALYLNYAPRMGDMSSAILDMMIEQGMMVEVGTIGGEINEKH